jgi:4'-phosphopantetheinyl transferase
VTPDIQISGREVHVWFTPTDSRNAAEEVERVLSPDERERAGRFCFDHLRHSFILARAGLRALVGAYLRVAPEDIRFRCGPMGKLALGRNDTLQFNLSHSHGLASFAFTLGCQIGIDVEWIRPLADFEDIAHRFFNAAEVTDMLSVPESDRRRAFFRCWTRKEAYVKAIGVGLSTPLDQFRVTFLPAEAPRIIQSNGDPEVGSSWSLHDLMLPPDYAGALAYRDVERPVRVFPQVALATLLTDRPCA